MYSAVRKYKVVPGTNVPDVGERVKSGFIPIVSKAPGFLAYYLLSAENDVLVTVSVFEDQAGAEESTRLAADWVKQNLASIMQGPPEVTAGKVLAHKTK